jgi:hypothetical protein
MKKKISLALLCLLMFSAGYAVEDSLHVFISDHLENYFLKQSETAYRQKNLSDLMSRKEYLEYKLNHTPYLRNISIFKNLIDYLPVNFIDKYYMSDIHLMSVYNFVDLKFNMQNPDYLMFSIPLNKWDITWKNFWKPNTYLKSWFNNQKGRNNDLEKKRN